MAEIAVSREVGVYSSNLETRSIASAGVRGRKTCDRVFECRQLIWRWANELAYLAEWVRFDLREFMLHIIRVHRLNLLASWSAQDLNDLHQLVDATLAGEQRLAQHQLCHHATS
jgi:hypothetical protein